MKTMSIDEIVAITRIVHGNNCSFDSFSSDLRISCGDSDNASWFVWYLVYFVCYGTPGLEDENPVTHDSIRRIYVSTNLV